MEIVGEYSQVQPYDDPRSGFFALGRRPSIRILCPACGGVVFRSYYWHDMAIDPSQIEFRSSTHLTETSEPLGLPDTIQRAYKAANKVITIDVNAYGCFWVAS